MATSDIPIRIVIPAYNEEKNLPALCARIADALKGTNAAYRLYIVDDGSTDNTRSTVEELGKRHPIQALTHETNRGIAAVFMTGLREALKDAADDDAIVVVEGDGTSDPTLIPDMCGALDSTCDVVIASRYASGGAYRNFPLKRNILSHGANVLLRLICRLPTVRDYTIFFRAYRPSPLRKAIEAYGDSFTSSGGFACNAEMLLRLHPFLHGVKEVPLIYDYSLRKGASSMRISSNILSYFNLFKIFFFDREKNR